MFGIPFLPGPLLYKIGRVARDAPPELRQAWDAFFAGMSETGEIGAVATRVPQLYPAFQEFGMSITDADEEISQESINNLLSSIRVVLDGALSDGNIQNLLMLIEQAACFRPFRKIARWVARNVESAYAFSDAGAPSGEGEPQSASAVFDSKPWESTPGYDGAVVPPAPLFLNDAGPRVAHLHYVLRQVGSIPVDALDSSQVMNFGQHTAEALKFFQSSHGLIDEGSCEPGGYDATTRALLLSILEVDAEPSEKEPMPGTSS